MVVLFAAMMAFADPTDCAQSVRSGDWKTAEQCYAAALQRDTSARTLQGAIRVYRKTLATEGPDKDRVYNLALALFRMDQPQDALELLDKYPEWNSERYALAGAAWRSAGDLEKSLRALHQAASLQPDNDNYRSDYILALLRAGLDNEASAELDRAVVAFPKSARIQGALGVLAFGRGDNSAAAARFRTAIELEPGGAEWHASLADVLSASNAFADAAQSYAAAIRLAPRDTGYLVKRGRTLLRLDRRVEAVADWRKAIRIDPGDVQANYELGKIAASGGDDKAALLYLEKVASSPDAPPEAFYQLGRVYKRLGRPRESALALKRFQELKQEAQ